MTGESMKQTLNAAARSARDAGAEALDTARAAGAEAVETVTQEARNLAGTAAQTLKAEVEACAEAGKAQVSDQGLKLTEALKARADQAEYDLERRMLHVIAGGIEDISDDLRSRSFSSLIRETERFARRNPGVFVAGAAVAGFILGRFARASADDDQASPAQAGRSGGHGMAGQGSGGHGPGGQGQGGERRSPASATSGAGPGSGSGGHSASTASTASTGSIGSTGSTGAGGTGGSGNSGSSAAAAPRPGGNQMPPSGAKD